MHITSGQLDYGIVTGQPKSLPKDINILKLNKEPFTFVSSPNSPNTIKNTVSNWLAYNKESTTYSYFSKEFMNIGLEAKPKFFSTSMELLKEIAISGEGTALLPKHFVSKDIKNGSLVVFKTKPLSRPIWLVSKKPLAHNKQIKAITKKINTLLTK
ncbi:MAG: LysR substrate binding domain [Patescibacteria group bacterium]|nr:LysR substrate binding domain [Patescibacteria group bacterium]